MFFQMVRRHPGPLGRPAAPTAWCLMLVLSLALGQAAAGLTAPGATAASSADALREQVAAAGNPKMQWLAAGFTHSLAIMTDGSLWAWGANWYGQLGDGTTTDRWSPVPVAGFGGPSTADFTVTNVTLDPSAPLVGGTFSAVITVKNRGTETGHPGTLRVWGQPA